jgi:hypothetical protein
MDFLNFIVDDSFTGADLAFLVGLAFCALGAKIMWVRGQVQKMIDGVPPYDHRVEIDGVVFLFDFKTDRDLDRTHPARTLRQASAYREVFDGRR